MLRNIDPLLNAEVLAALRAMGHGDTVVIVDSNFFAAEAAKQTTHNRVLRIDADAPRTAQAILSVLPLDSFVENPACRVEFEDPATIPPVQQEVQAVVEKMADADVNKTLGAIERFAFYQQARQAYCLIATNEHRFWGNFLFTKGVIAPEKE